MRPVRSLLGGRASVVVRVMLALLCLLPQGGLATAAVLPAAVLPATAPAALVERPRAQVACTPTGTNTNCVRLTYSGGDQTFTVPPGVTTLFARLWGAGGGGVLRSYYTGQFGGGGGGHTTGNLTVTPGQQLTVTAGQGGVTNSSAVTYGGGGAGGQGRTEATGGSGGGLSAVWAGAYGTNPLLIAGGGGGASPGADTNSPAAGAGGGATGGQDGQPAYSGRGGTQNAGGAAATQAACTGTAGTRYRGGTGGNASTNEGGGGGGGGNYGGGGGACQRSGEINGMGGGGSGYTGGAGVFGTSTGNGTNSSANGVGGLSGGRADAQYSSGTGVGGGYGNGGNGEVVLEWQTRVQLSVTKTADKARYVPGQALTYTVVVRNAGPAPAVGAAVRDALPSALSAFTWTCAAASANSSCGAASGTGNLDTTATIGANDSVTYTITGTVPPTTTGTLSNTATVTRPSASTDPNCGPTCSSTLDTPGQPTSGLSVTKTADKNPYVPGQPLTYTITVKNAGPSDATGVGVRDTLPTAIRAFSWSCAASGGSSCGSPATGTGDIATTVNLRAGGQVVYTLTGTVPADATGSLDNRATVTPPGGTADPGCTPNCTSTSNPIPPAGRASLTVSKVLLTDPVVPGQEIRWRVTVTNGGPSVARDVVVRDQVPAGVTGAVMSADAGGVACPVSSGVAVCPAVELAVGASASWTLSGTLSPDATVTPTNVVTVTGGPDPASPTRTAVASPSSSPSAAARLSVAKVLLTDPVVPGQEIRWRVTVTNNGPSRARGVVVRDTVPTGVSGASMRADGGGADCPIAGGVAVCPAVELAVGGSASWTLSGTLSPDATVTPTNVVTVTGGPDPASPTRTAVASPSSSPSPLARLSVSKVLLTDPVVPGEQVQWRVTVTNNGPSRARDVVVRDTVPTGVSGASMRADGGGADCPIAGGVAVCPAVELAVGGSASWTLSGTLSPDATVTPTNVVTVTGGPDPASPTRTAVGSPSNSPSLLARLSVSKVLLTDPVVPGQEIRWRVTVTNNGPSVARGVVVRDQVPAGVSNPSMSADAAGGADCPIAGGVAVCPAVELAVGGSASWTLSGTLSPDATVTPTNVVTVMGGPDPVSPTRTAVASPSNSPSPLARLSVSKVLLTDPVVPGQEIRWRVTVTNNGPSVARGVVVRDQVPAGVSGASMSADAGGASCAISNGTATCPAVELAVGASVSWTLSGTLSPDATVTPTNVVTVMGGPDPASPTRTAVASPSSSPSAVARLSVSKVLLTDPVVPGEQVQWRVTVTNNGPSRARDVVVRDTVPTGVSGASMRADGGGADCPIADGVATCPAVELAVGASSSWTLTGVLDSDATSTPANSVVVTGGPDPVSPTRTAVASPSSSPSAVARLSVAKVLLTDPVVPGQQVQWRVTVTNDGPSRARNVVVSDQVPAGVSSASMSADAGGASCPISNGTATCPAVELAVGASASWTLSGTLSPDATVTPVNAVVVTGGPDPVSPTRTAVASPSNSPSPLARLSVSKVLLTDPVVPGQEIRWRVTVTNNGPSRARDVVVKDQVPGGVEAASMKRDVDGAPCPISGGVATCPAIEMAVGSTVTYTLAGVLDSNATSTPVNSVVVTGGPDPVSPTRTAVASPTNSFSPQARLTVSKVLLTDPVVPGQDIRWRVTVTNNGPSVARSVVVTDQVPVGVSNPSMSADAEGTSCSIADDVVTCPAVELAVGSSDSWTLSGTLSPDATVTPTNVVTVTGGPDPASPTRTAVASPTNSPSPQARLTVSKVLLTDPVVPGQPVRWRVTVTNEGPSRARDVVVSDQVPVGVSNPSMSADADGAGCPVVGGVATCPAVEIAAGATLSWTLTGVLDADATSTPVNVVVVTGGPDPVTPTRTAVASPTSSPSPLARLSVSKVLLTDPVVPGQDIRWRVTVTNGGPSVARDVVVRDQVPAGVAGAVMSPDVGGGACPIVDGVATCPAVELAVGASRSWTLSGTLSPDATVTPTNTVVVTGGPDPAEPTHTAVASPTNSPSPQARLTVSKVLLTDPVVPGQQVQWRVAVTNNGPSRARDVVVRDTVPTGVSGASMRADGGGDCPIDGGVATCPAIELAAGGTVTYTLSGVLDADATVTPVNVVVVTGGPDPVSPTRTAVASPSSSPSPLARLSVSKVLLTDPVVPGQQVQWRVAVTNNGPSRARDVVVRDTVPTGVSGASMRADDGGGDCPIAEGVATCPAVEIAAGASSFWTLTGTLSPDAMVTPTNTVVVTGGPDPAEPTHTAVASPTNSPSSQARLTVSKVLLTDPVVPGQEIRWRVTVTNSGPSVARDVVVSDQVPAEVTGASMSADAGAASCPIISGVAMCPAVEIGVGQSLSWTLTGMLSPDAMVTPVNAVVVTGGPDPASPTRTAVASPSNSPSPQARLTVSKVLLTDPVVPGQEVQWRVTVTNDGPSRARQVVVRDTVPTGITNAVMRADDVGADCPIADGVATCPAVELAVGAPRSWTLSGTLNPDATATPTNMVVVTGGPDPVTPTHTAVASPSDSPSAVARLSVSKVLLTDPVVPGEQVQWRVTVTNDGPSRARDVVVADRIPAGVRDASMRVDADRTLCLIDAGVAMCPAVEIGVGQSLSWTLTGMLSPDATVTPTNTVTVTGGPDPAEPTHTAVASPSNSLSPQARLTVSKVLLTSPVIPGQRIQWRVTVTNDGPSRAREVVVRDTVPTGVADPVMAADGDGGNCAILGGVATCPAVEIGVGESLSWTLSGVLGPNVTATPVNTVTVTGGPDPVSPTRTAVASPSDLPSPVARLSVSKVLLTDPVVPGEQVQWRVTVTNDGPSRARDVVVADRIPAGVRDASMRADADGTPCPIDAGVAMCPAVEIAVGESLSWTLSGMLSPDATVTPVNSVVVTGGPDPVSPTRTAVASPTNSPSPMARLSVSKVLLTDPVVPGQQVRWRVTVTNDGPSRARGVVVTDTVPVGITDVVMRADSDGAECPIAGGVATCPAVEIAVGESSSWTLTGTLDSDATVTPTNTVVVTGGPDPITPTHTAVASPSSSPGAAARLSVSKVLLTNPVVPGEQVQWRVAVTNNGPSVARGVVVTDRVPAALSGAVMRADSDGAECPIAGGVAMCPAVEIAVGESLSWTLSGMLSPDATVTPVNSVVVTGGPDPVSPTRTAVASPTNSPSPMARLSVSKVLLTDPVVPGQQVRWRVTVTNDGPSRARGVVVRDTVPVGITDVVMRADSNGADCPISSGMAMCPAVEIAVGESLSWTLSGMLSPDATVTPVNSVVVTGGPDPVSPTRTAVASPSASPSAVARLTVAKVLLTSPVVAGRPVAWRVTVTNEGPSLAREVVVADRVPDGVTGAVMRADSDGADCPVVGGTATCPAVSIPVGTTLGWTLTGTLSPDATETPLNSVVVTGGPDPATPTRTAVASPSEPISVRHALRLDKKVSPAAPSPGDRVVYTVTARNEETGTYRGAVVVDDFGGVLGAAEYDGDARATAGRVDYAEPRLTWTLDLRPGAVETLVYGFTVRPDAGGRRMENTVGARGDGTNCPVPMPRSRRAAPAAAGRVDAGCATDITVNPPSPSPTPTPSPSQSPSPSPSPSVSASPKPSPTRTGPPLPETGGNGGLPAGLAALVAVALLCSGGALLALRRGRR